MVIGHPLTGTVPRLYSSGLIRQRDVKNMTFNQLKNKIKKLHWVWFWSGNWPLLDAFYERDEYFAKEFKKLTGVDLLISLDFYTRGILTAYHCQEEYNHIESSLRKKFKKDPLYIQRSLTVYHKRILKDIKTLRKTSKLDFASLTNKKLALVFANSRRHFAVNSAYDHYCWYLEKFFVPDLQKYLKKRLKELNKSKELSEYLFTLLTPWKASRVYLERKDLFRMIKKIRKDKKLVKKLNKLHISSKSLEGFKINFSKIYRLVENHLKKYAYLPVLVNNPPVSRLDIWEEIQYFVKSKANFKIKSKRLGDSLDKYIKIKRQRIIKELEPERKIKQLIKDLRNNAYIRTEDNAIMGQSSLFIMPLLGEIAKRLGLRYQELKQLTPREIIYNLRKNKKASKGLIKDRLRLTASIVFRDKRLVIIGGKAENLKKIIERQLSKYGKREVSQFKGVAACFGRVKGRIKIALSSKQAKSLKSGEILIAPATSADFVPAMRRAAAIITEFGGITSHAGVIAREFSLPCIVGVKNITKRLKDGDVVEVDANKGIVRLLGRTARSASLRQK